MKKERLILTLVILVVLVGLVVVCASVPALRGMYSQAVAAILALLGVHHGSDLLDKKLSSGDGVPDAEPDAEPVATLPEPKPVATLPEPKPEPKPVAALPEPKPVDITAALLGGIMPQAPRDILDEHARAAASAAKEWRIDITPERVAAWLANIALECDQLRHLIEEWGPSQAQLRYEPPSHVARILGNTNAGDGRRFLGRGLIQLTGRFNYRLAGRALDLPLETSPHEAAQPGTAWRIAGWFWASRGLNKVADAGDFRRCVEVINGGLMDLKSREYFHERACRALGIAAA